LHVYLCIVFQFIDVYLSEKQKHNFTKKYIAQFLLVGWAIFMVPTALLWQERAKASEVLLWGH
jgi:vacuolar-type H+-ATPase subunit I/STV1